MVTFGSYLYEIIFEIRIGSPRGHKIKQLGDNSKVALQKQGIIKELDVNMVCCAQ